MKHLVKTYSIGFILSLALTLVAYSLAVSYTNNPHSFILPLLVLVSIILFIALIQLGVQLIFFLHLGKEKASRWNVVFFASTFSAVVIIIVASIWIMNHLDYNMTPAQVLQYIQNQSGF